MNLRSLVLVGMSVFLFSAARATPPSPAVLEIDYLLQQVETFGCAFYRNGSWYDGPHAMAHLRMKYNYLAARNLIGSAEDFIDKAASKSSMTGQPYKVKCDDGSVIESSQWLRKALEGYRAAKQSAPVP